MKYITISDLSDTIRRNIWKIPHDIDFIIGIPRSGMIAASIIASYLNVPLIDINSYLLGLKPYGGARLNAFVNKHQETNKVLIVDDTIFNGTTINNVKKYVSNKPHNFIYLCVYAEGNGLNNADIYLEDVRSQVDSKLGIVLYEWNILQHHDVVLEKCLYDMDGVLCLDPPDERNEEEYINYIKNATPLFIPRGTIGGILTYRLVKNKEITQEWLKNNRVTYYKLMMFNANSWEERHNTNISPEQYKGETYKNSNYELFVESNEQQAINIANISNKPVYVLNQINYIKL